MHFAFRPRLRAHFVRVAFFLGSVFPSLSLAQGGAAVAPGDLVGDVSNASTKASLEGAVVQIAGTSHRTLTDSTGHFAFNKLPPGDYTVAVQYPGLDGATKNVSIPPGAQATADFALTSGIYQMQEFRITAEREGNAAAITRQRNAGNIINVVALDAYGDVADGNIGNFMMKLPGVSTQIAEGDAVGISLRGAPPSMTMTSLDGTQMSSAGAGDTGKLGDRSGIIDRIPAEFIKEVEVTKASTPDMDSTGLGGGIKLVTKSAFDFKETTVATYSGGYNKNTYRTSNPWTPTAALTLMRKFGPEQKIGLTLSSSYTATIVTRDRAEMTHPDTTNDITTGMRFLDDSYHRIRFGAGAKLEYKAGDNFTVYLDSLYSRYLSNTDRYDVATAEVSGHLPADYSIVSRAAIEGGATPMTSSRTPAGIAPGATDRLVELLNRTVTNKAADDLRRDMGIFVAAGGTKKWGATELSARATYNFNKYDREFDTFTATLAKVGFRVDQTQSLDRPGFAQTYGPNFLDLSQSTATLGLQYQHPRDRQYTATVDVQRKLELGGLALRLKSGLKFVEAKRTIISYSHNFDVFGADGIAGRNPATGVNDDNLTQFLKDKQYGLFAGKIPSMAQIDYGKVRSVLQSGSGYFKLRPSTRSPGTQAVEDVYAAYAMGELTMGKLTVLAGARGEDVANESTGNATGVSNVTQITKDGRYDKLFPSIHARYAIQPTLLLRASYSTTMNRPAIADLIPTTSVTAAGNGGTVTQGNSDLKPQLSKNYDLMLEYYFNPVGVLSVGAYKKDLTGFIATLNEIIPSGANNGFGGDYAGYTLVTKENLSSALITGYEINYDQQLRNLPRPFNTLSVFANYSRIHTSGTYDTGVTRLALFTPKLFNVGFSYSLWRFQLRTFWNYTGAIYNNASLVNPTWISSAETVNVNVQYKVNSRLNASINVANLFNKWPSVYSLNPQRLATSEVYGTRITLGVNGRF